MEGQKVSEDDINVYTVFNGIYLTDVLFEQEYVNSRVGKRLKPALYFA